jgi:hypothetical protein
MQKDDGQGFAVCVMMASPARDAPAMPLFIPAALQPRFIAVDSFLQLTLVYLWWRAWLLWLFFFSSPAWARMFQV